MTDSAQNVSPVCASFRHVGRSKTNRCQMRAYYSCRLTLDKFSNIMTELLEYPRTDLIDPDKARDLFNYCAILVIEALPIGSGFGIDLCEFCTGEKFKGVKLIPPGLHFVFASSVSSDRKQSVGPRCGFYHNFMSKELVLKRWSPKDEAFDNDFVPTKDYLERYQSNLCDLDRYLGAYRYSTYHSYKTLTDKLSPELVQQIFKDPNSSELNFTKLNKNHKEALVNREEAAAITRYYLDTTTRLELVFRGDEGLDRLLGEFQLAFITLIVLHIYECFEHWLELLNLLCHADQGISRYPNLFVEFISVLRNQLQHVPEDLFEDVSDTTNRMRAYLDIFFQNVDATPNLDGDLKREASDLKSCIEEKFNWQFNLEPDDEVCLVEDIIVAPEYPSPR